MTLSGVVKERVAKVIGDFFSTNDIENVFSDLHISTNRELFAKWRITLDAFNKMSDQGVSIFDAISSFCHPLRFEEKEIVNPLVRTEFIEKLNAVLSYDKIELKDSGDTILIMHDGAKVEAMEPHKTPIDYVADAVNFFKDEYNKVKVSGLTYDYFLYQNAPPEYKDEDYPRLEAIKQLKNVGFITEYKIEQRVDGDVSSYAICKIDESKLTQREQLPAATDAGVQEIIHKVEITAMPELAVRNLNDAVISKGTKRIHLPHFKSTNWSDITIRFIDERNIIISTGKENKPTDCESLGFENEKNGKPNLAWIFFYGIALNNGETKPLRNPIPDNVKQQKRRISDFLKKLFQNDSEPFLYDTETRTYKIKINLIPPQANEDENDKLGIREYLKDEMPEEYDDQTGFINE